jgi:hypothetical protein
MRVGSACLLTCVLLTACPKESEKKKSSDDGGDKAAASAEPSSTAQEKAKARDAAIKKRLAFIESVKDKLPPTATAPKVDTSVPMPNILASADAPTVNAAVEPVDHLTDMHRLDRVSPIYDDAALHWAAAHLKGREGVNEYKLDDAAAKRFLAVVRVTKVDARITSPTTYTPGTCIGDAVVYDFESGKLVAHVPIRGTNSDQVTQHLGEVKPEKYLNDDLDRGCLTGAQLHIDAAYGKK